MLLGATGNATAQRIAWYVGMLGSVAPDALADACKRASQETKRQVASPAEIMAALNATRADASPERQREERGEIARRIADMMDDAVPSICDGTTTDLRGRVRWLTVQARKGGTWGDVANVLLQRERTALDRALQREADRQRELQRPALHATNPPPLDAA